MGHQRDIECEGVTAYQCVQWTDGRAALRKRGSHAAVDRGQLGVERCDLQGESEFSQRGRRLFRTTALSRPEVQLAQRDGRDTDLTDQRARSASVIISCMAAVTAQ